ncbi:MAG: hypothetical protein QG669_498 [Patescibacteria group bacterium]|nr:hypothetical protein [Patescibacteria group bacterium]
MSISKYFPSRKFSILLIICALVAIVYFVFFNSSNDKTSKQVKTVTLTPTEIIEGDRDEDGIRDWEEALWGTNPDNKDSDGDGIDDLVEIEEKRSKLSSGNTGSVGEEVTLNETEMFSRDIFASIISLREKGALNDESLKSLAEATGKSFTGKVEIDNVVETADIQTLPDDTPSKKNYIKSVDTLMAAYWQKGINQEYEIFGKYVVSENKELLAELNQIATAYENLSNELKKLSVPSSLVITHRDLVNTTYKMNVATKNIAQADTNELVSAIGIAQYKDQIIEFTRLLNVYTVLLSQYGTL